MKPLRSLALVVIAITATTALAFDSGVAAAATRTRTITVVGTGEVRGTPDVADLVLGRLRARRHRGRGDEHHR